MNITSIRQSAHVYTYSSHNEGCLICYIKDKTSRSLSLTSIQLLNELIAMGSLDEDVTPEEFADYNISQWDALNLVIRHESAIEMDKELDNSDIGKAISNITKPNT